MSDILSGSNTRDQLYLLLVILFSERFVPGFQQIKFNNNILENFEFTLLSLLVANVIVSKCYFLLSLLVAMSLSQSVIPSLNNIKQNGQQSCLLYL